MTQTTDALKKLLANTYCLTIKTQNYHWNIEGTDFFQLHEAFENQYTELSGSIDEIAERVRALGEKAPGSFSEFDKLKTLEEARANISGKAMVEDLLKSHEALSSELRQGMEIAGNAKDDVTTGLMSDRLYFHEKTVWMLKSFLAK
ncbi:MAG: Dps family protein [Gammaproteobacteria bacterium]